MLTLDMQNVCLETHRNNRIGLYKLRGWITQEFLGLRIRNFQGLFSYELEHIGGFSNLY